MKKKEINICAIIPARSGSKSIRNNNILKIGGVPIFAPNN
jgi:CMP-N-acetylneuraminic acid synthetase|tara:strand:+ start:456 stop:575 length:120 start_codon:yes stop_codon:yes gene_type:complete